MKGWRWGVGNGLKVKIWDDPWLTDEHYSKILTLKNGSNLMKVSELIDTGRVVWKESLIKQTFVDRDLDQILGIPLSVTDMEDKMTWEGTTSGQFSMKSAYVIAKDLIQSRGILTWGRGQSSGDSDDEGAWKKGMAHEGTNEDKDVPLAMFTWDYTCQHDATQRKVPVDPICSLCGWQRKHHLICFFNCVRAMKV